MKKSLKYLITQKYVALYDYVKMCLNNLLKKNSFSNHLRIVLKSITQQKN